MGRVVPHLRTGGLIAYPTETVYGFGCALRAAPLAALARLKDRSPERPFLVLVKSMRQVDDLAWTPAARALAAAFWPGPLTLALRLGPSGNVAGCVAPPEIVSATATVAVRASPHVAVAALLQGFGEPITSTSANARGSPPATDGAGAASAARAVARAAGEDAETLFVILDGGVLPSSPPSTVLDCSTERPRLVRAGALSLESLRQVVSGIDCGDG